jgi:hypothetical protein
MVVQCLLARRSHLLPWTDTFMPHHALARCCGYTHSCHHRCLHIHAPLIRARDKEDGDCLGSGDPRHTPTLLSPAPVSLEEKGFGATREGRLAKPPSSGDDGRAVFRGLGGSGGGWQLGWGLGGALLGHHLDFC